MYSKIQPQQINLHAFSSPSGHFDFEQGSDYVYADLSPTISGNFNIVGTLSLNGAEVSTADSSNIFDNRYNYIVAGFGNNIEGIGNAILNGEDSFIFGENNVILNGYNCSIDEDSEKNTIVAGSYCNIGGTTGTTIIQDQSSVVVNATKNNALYVSFTGGSYFATQLHMQDHLYLEQLSHLYLSSSSSGIFSGDINVLGNLYWQGALIPTMAQLTGTSGVLAASIASTGTSLNSKLTIISGQAFNSVQLTGNQTITGDKTFNGDVFLHPSSIISSTGISGNYIQLSDNVGLPSETLKIVSKNSAAILFDAFSEATSFANLVNNDYVDYDACFVVGTEGESININTPKLIVDSFGNTKIAGTLIAEGLSVYQPSDASDTFGPNGLITKTGDYLYIKQDDGWSKFKASDWVEKTGEIWLDGANTSITWIDGKIQNNGRVDIFSTGGGGGGFFGNGIAGDLYLNGVPTLAWSNGLVTTATNESFDFLTLNGQNGSRTFVTPTGTSSITWVDGQITSTGDVSIDIPSGSPSIIGSGDYVFPPSGWEEMTMNFTDVDGFLRTRTFLVRSI